MLRRLMFFVVFLNLLVLSSCCVGVQKSRKHVAKTKFLSIEEVIKKRNSNWAFFNCGVSSSILHFNFKTFNRMTLQLGDSCRVIFPIAIHQNKIEVLWRPEIITNEEYAIIGQLRKYSKHRPFMRFTLKNDSTIAVMYYNRDFQNKLNAYDKQRILFPDTYHFLDTARMKQLNLTLE